MDFFPFLIPIPVSTSQLTSDVAGLQQRVERLEHALVLSLDVIQTLLGKLEGRLGSNVVGPELRRWQASRPEPALVQALNEINDLVKAGQSPKAARLFREAFGVTWDQAHQAIAEWHRHSQEEKLRWLRLVSWIKTMDGPG